MHQCGNLGFELGLGKQFGEFIQVQCPKVTDGAVGGEVLGNHPRFTNLS
jgi:hypothetical protein